MPQAPKRPCSGRPGCPALVTAGERFCPSCQQKHNQQRTDSARHYDRHVRDPQVTAFYKSRAWEAVRQAVLVRDHGLCQPCLRDERLTTADIVHHLVEVKVDWSRRLDLTNLESVCAACHNRIHGVSNRHKLSDN